MRIGSLFSGYGGLDIGVQSVLGGHVVWHSDIDKSASAILKYHYPDIPNLGDISKVDWSTVEPIDVLTGGFPCQDVSTAGARRGLHSGTRSGLWSVMAEAIQALQPSLVVIENVRGLLSATASSDMEPCTWCLGDTGDESALRALGAVLGDLAELGFHARWASVRASDVGACHRRERVFIIAWPQRADADSIGRNLERPQSEGRNNRQPQSWPKSLGSETVTHADNRRRRVSNNGLSVATQCGDSTTTNPGSQRHGGRKDVGMVGSVGTPAAVSGRESGSAWPESGNRSTTNVSDAHSPRRQGFVCGESCAQAGRCRHPQSCSHVATNIDSGRRVESIIEPGNVSEEKGERSASISHRHSANGSSTAVNWGPYQSAIDRWETMLGRQAPSPTEPGPNDRHRLNSVFVEWMMGLPLGHVSNPQIGLSRANQLKVLGNGVVPQQAAHALRILLNLQP